MIAAPSFQFYPKDVLSSGELAALSLEEMGAYTLLLCYDWSEVGLPMDLKILAKLLRISEKKMQKFWKNLAKFFPESDTRWRNPTLQIEREKQAVRRASLSENGKKGGRPPKANALDEESKSFNSEKHLKSLASSSSSSTASASEVLTTSCTEPQTAADSMPAAPPVILLPCLGEKGPWPVSNDQLAKWQVSFPATDVLAQLRKMVAWTEANPSHRKTYGGVARFVVSWLSKEQDRGPPRVQATNGTHRLSSLEQTRAAIDSMLDKRAAS